MHVSLALEHSAPLTHGSVTGSQGGRILQLNHTATRGMVLQFCHVERCFNISTVILASKQKPNNKQLAGGQQRLSAQAVALSRMCRTFVSHNCMPEVIGSQLPEAPAAIS
jgi:hypothetical protein